tara:strand:+ start:178990 stop:179988 length:999 start_codon:yes stop_codon:yes gene_type:complete
MKTIAPDKEKRHNAVSDKMRAVVFDDYGDADVLRLVERPTPKRKAGELLIEVHASSVNPIDYRLRSGEMKALLPGGFPRIPGYDVAGVVVDCDDNSSFERGQHVIAFLDHLRGGACAEYAVCSNGVATPIRETMSMRDAAAIPLAGTTALQSLRDHGKIEPTDRVLINGASGGVGIYAVQIAKAYGCQVDAVASGDNRDFCLSLGADRFFDYEKENYVELDEQWDLIFDASGKSNYWDSRHVMSEHGRYISTEPNPKGMLMTLITWPLSKSGTVMLAKPRGNDLRELIRLYELGKLSVTIDSCFPLEQTADAHRRVEHGVDRGKVVIVHRDD